MSRDRISFVSSALANCRVVHAKGREALNELPRWELELLCEGEDENIDGLLGSSAALVLTSDVSAEERVSSLIVTSVAYTGFHRRAHRYRVELGVPAEALSLRSDHRIFQNQTTQQIVAQVLTAAGVVGDKVAFRLVGKYLPLVHTTQHGETDWAFVERLLAEDGIAYWHDLDTGGVPVLIISDNPNAYAPIAGDATVTFHDPSGMSAPEEHVFSFELTTGIGHDAVHVRDYDPEKPDYPIDGRAGTGLYEHYEFPSGLIDQAAAGNRAVVRLEQLRRLVVHARAESNSARLHPGRTFKLEGIADEELEGEYVVVAVEHELRASVNDVAGGKPYKNELLLVPKTDRVFRPAPPTLGTTDAEPDVAPGKAPARPRVEGLQTAITTGPAGEEIHVDPLGCVKVRFHWDRSGIGDDKSSRWVRTLQQNLGGAMMLPRVAWEVPIAFAWGDPDRPVVLGRMYNATTPAPYGLPAASASTGLKSATSPGGGSVNELRLSDDAGAMGFLLNASRDLTMAVANDLRTEVAVNAQHAVKKALEMIVDGAHSLSVTASQHISTDSHFKLDVGSVRVQAVGGLEMLNITKSRELGVTAAYVEAIAGFYGIQCNQDNTAILGGLLHAVGGILNQTAGITIGESVAGVRTLVVGGPRLVLTALKSEEAVSYGGITITASGGSVDKALINVKTEVKAASNVTFTSAKMAAGESLVLKAPDVFVTASTLKLVCGQTVELEGGTLKVGGGKGHVKATLKRKQAAKTGA